MHKLINPDGKIHDYAGKMYWGHNIDGSDDGTPVIFEGLQTLQYEWAVFNSYGLDNGDFITRRSSSLDKVLLYELAKVKRYGDPGDMYNVTANLCGYYLPDGTMEIVDGYGVVPIDKTWFYELIKRIFRNDP